MICDDCRHYNVCGNNDSDHDLTECPDFEQVDNIRDKINWLAGIIYVLVLFFGTIFLLVCIFKIASYCDSEQSANTEQTVGYFHCPNCNYEAKIKGVTIEMEE